MKNLNQICQRLILLFVFLFSSLIFAGDVPHLAGGTVRYDTGNIPDVISVTAYIQSRPDEVLSNESAGCGYEDGYFWIQCGNFLTNWQAGEILSLEVADAAGHQETGTIVLTSASLDTTHFVLHPVKHTITVKTFPAGLAVYVDDEAYFTPVTFQWEENTDHTIDVLTPQIASIDTRYLFFKWSQGGNQAQTLSVNQDIEITAEFVPQFKLYTYSYPAGSGSVQVSPEKTWYDDSESVQLMAMPNTSQGYLFNYWNGDASGTANPINVQMSSVKTITSYFSPKGVNLNTNNSPEDGGYIIIDPPKNQYFYGDTISVFAVENSGEGFFFHEWQGDLSGFDNPAIMVLSEDIEITAFYRKVRYRLNMMVEPSNGGAFQLAPNKMNFEYGEDVIITALPADGYRFYFWSGDILSLQNPDTVSIKKDMTIVVNFTQSTVINEINIVPKSYKLKQNYPNPFNASTQIPFELPEACHMKIVIYNSLGEVTRNLIHDYRSAGVYEILWDGKNNSGITVQSGLYFVQFISKHYHKRIKILCIK